MVCTRIVKNAIDMDNKKEVIGIGIVTIELGIDVWIYNRFVKRRKQTKEISAVSDDVVNDTETAMPLQTPISQKRMRTRITSGMIRKWDMMAKRGMSHKQIAAEYGVSLRGMERHLSRKVMNKTVKEEK